MLIDFLVVWRLTHLLNKEDGPFDLIFRFKQGLVQHRHRQLFKLVTCFYCLSVWVGLAIAILESGLHKSAIPYGIALSGLAILAQNFTGDK